jgi:hypothetical protein
MNRDGLIANCGCLVLPLLALPASLGGRPALPGRSGQRERGIDREEKLSSLVGSRLNDSSERYGRGGGVRRGLGVGVGVGVEGNGIATRRPSYSLTYSVPVVLLSVIEVGWVRQSAITIGGPAGSLKRKTSPGGTKNGPCEQCWSTR